MSKASNDKLQGTMDLLVLKSLASRGPLHGYGITEHIEEAGSGVLCVEEGSLYPALHRMAQDGWIRAEWGVSENNRRARYYAITPAGRKRLAQEEARWTEVSAAVNRVLTFA